MTTEARVLDLERQLAKLAVAVDEAHDQLAKLAGAVDEAHDALMSVDVALTAILVRIDRLEQPNHP